MKKKGKAEITSDKNRFMADKVVIKKKAISEKGQDSKK